MTIPTIIKYANEDPKVRNAKVLETISVTRDVSSVKNYAVIYADLLISVLNGKDLR